jgi:hypothetical protein
VSRAACVSELCSRRAADAKRKKDDEELEKRILAALNERKRALVIGQGTRLVIPRDFRRFRPPWSIEELEACSVVRDHNGQQRDTVGRCSGPMHITILITSDKPPRTSAGVRRMSAQSPDVFVAFRTG